MTAEISSPQSVRELIERQYGITTTEEENPQVTTVGVSSVVVFRNNPRRLSLTIVNLSANAMYVRPGGLAASATAGIYLPPNGGSIAVVWNDDLTLATREWQAIASVGASAIYAIGVVILGTPKRG